MALGVGDIDVNATPGMMRGMAQGNALSKQALENLYYGPKTMAQVASQLSYANAVGPQILAKLLGNDKAVASLQSGQPENMGQIIYNTGTGQQVTPQIAAAMQAMQRPQNPIARLLQSLPIIGNVFGGGNNNQQPMQQPGGQQVQPQMQQPGTQQPAMPNQNQTIPYKAPMQEPVIPAPTSQTGSVKGYFKRGGELQGIETQEKEGGKHRADAIADMGKEYKASQQLNDAYEEMTTLMNNPKFQNMRKNIPFFQSLQMSALEKAAGTPEEKEMIGTFKQAAQKILANAVNSYEGRKFLGEFQTTSKMKINENDNFSTIVGKLKAGRLLNDYSQSRIDIATDLMDREHKNEKDAFKEADKLLDRKKIQSDVDNLIQIPIKNKKTGEVKNISIVEARKMGIPNV